MILADTGFWVALADRRDHAHSRAVSAAREFAEETLVTTWPVMTEVSYFLQKREGPAKVAQFFRDFQASSNELFSLDALSLPRIETLMHKYRDLPMDLADASLVVLAEELGEGRIFSTDERDFKAYRWKNTKPFKNLLVL